MENPSLHRYIITCEHALNWVPDRFIHHFADAEKVLVSHRGWDPGALIIAHTISYALQSPLFIYPFTRLLIEPNRSEQHPDLFSEFTRQLIEAEKTQLKENLYRPYRNSVEEKTNSFIEQRLLPIHLSVHTFTPVLHGSERDFDIGLLYDPSRAAEKFFCSQWKTQFLRLNSNLKIRINQPYRGTSDGFTTSLRRRFNDTYIGIELEVNQKLFFDSDGQWIQLCKLISNSLLHIQTNQLPP